MNWKRQVGLVPNTSNTQWGRRSRITKKNMEIGGHSSTDTVQCFDILIRHVWWRLCMVEVDQEDFFIRLILIWRQTSLFFLSVVPPRAWPTHARVFLVILCDHVLCEWSMSWLGSTCACSLLTAGFFFFLRLEKALIFLDFTLSFFGLYNSWKKLANLLICMNPISSMGQ